MFIRIRHRALWSGLLVLALLAAMLPGMDSAQAQDSDPVTPTSGEPLTTPTTEADAPVDETSQDTPPADTPEATAEPTSEPTPEPEEEAGDTPTPEPLEAITPEPEETIETPDQPIEVMSSEGGQVIPDEYIIVFKPQFKTRNNEGVIRADVAANGGRVIQVYKYVLNGFSANLPPQALKALQRNPNVESISPNVVISIAQEISPAGEQPVNEGLWGLDRIDQRDLPLNSIYSYDYTGSGVHAYVVDTGIRYTHTDFGGRVITTDFYDFYGGDGSDCNGHGTHVAGTIGGSTYGVAKNVTLHSVRVLYCDGKGSPSSILAGLDWIAENHIDPAVVNMSLAADGIIPNVDTAVINLINDYGVFVVVAAGNANPGADACNITPARVPEAFTVGNSTSTDYRYTGIGPSNYGACLDLFAPGTGIVSTSNTSNTATNTMSGTSMSAPHAAGAAALYLQANLSASVAQVTNALLNQSSKNRLTDIGSGSPNLLLYTLSATEPFVTTFLSSATYDGWVLESSRASSKGGSLNRTATTVRVGDDSKNRQYRSILHFSTGALPDTAVITSVQLRVRRASITGTNPFKTHSSLYVDIRKGAFSGSSKLQLGDWQASATKSAAGKISSTSSSNWHTLKLSSSYHKYINKTGVTQLRLRFYKQDNGDKGSDYISFYSGNATSSNRPKLIVTYYLP